MKDNVPVSVGQLAEWIIANRKGSAFKNDTFENICAGIQEDIKNNNLLFVLDDDSEIIGVVSFTSDRTNRILFVRNILITRHSALVIFAAHFKQHFDGYIITANRGNQEIMYNTSRLIGHLLKGGY